MDLKNKLRQHLKNSIGKSVQKKYLVIESDDWGSVRMPSLKAFENLKSSGVNLGKGETERYNLTDTLAAAEDFEALFSTLRKFKDQSENHPVFTAVSVVANPDFEKIKSANFECYYFEPFTETLKKYQRESALVLWKEGTEERLFVPEFHAREHLNVPVWLRMLQKGDSHTTSGFNQGCWGFKAETPFGIGYQAAFDVETPDDLLFHEEALRTGLELFKSIHGYSASFFVAPNGPFNNSLEKVTAENGIKFIGASKIQLEPQGMGQVKKRYHWMGKRNKYDQIYLTRNAFFEPNAPGKDWVASCLEDIHYAFLWKKPAVISSHRTNYIGSLDPKNRANSLEKLEELLRKVVSRWPDVEFITSTELGRIMALGK
jgi:hypothetical protein